MQFDPVDVLQEPVQDPIGDGRLPECFVPHGDRQLARDDCRAQPDAVLDHLEQVGGLVGDKRPQQEVVDDQDVRAGPSGQQPREPSVGAGQ